MVKRTITEETCEYDRDGELVRKVVKTTTEEDDSSVGSLPSQPTDTWWKEPYINLCKTDLTSDSTAQKTEEYQWMLK